MAVINPAFCRGNQTQSDEPLWEKKIKQQIKWGFGFFFF